MFSYTKNKKAKIKAVGKTLRLLTLLESISKSLVERISKEKGVSLGKAEDIIVDRIKDGMKTIKEQLVAGKSINAFKTIKCSNR